jgi:hypothetical protein
MAPFAAKTPEKIYAVQREGGALADSKHSGALNIDFLSGFKRVLERFPRAATDEFLGAKTLMNRSKTRRKFRPISA